jgi:transcriptional regulator with XRE-family HTH domain
MGRSTPPVLPSLKNVLQHMGESLRLARLRRRLQARQVAERAGMSLPTLRAIERGSEKVAMGAYASVLQVLGLAQDLALVAASDPLGRRLQDAGLPTRVRTPRAPKRTPRGPAR